MHLNQIKDHPILKFFASIAFVFIIISFVSFYGWSGAAKSAGRERRRVYARLQAAEGLTGPKWHEILVEDVQRAKKEVINEKLSMISPQVANMLMQQGLNTSGLATEDEAAERAANDVILQYEVARMGVGVSEGEAITRIKQQFQSSPDAFFEMLDREGLSESQFIRRVRQDQAALRIQSFIGNEAKINLQDLWDDYRLRNEKVKLLLASWPAKKLAENVKPTDADLEAYLKEHHEDYRLPDQRRYQYVKRSLGDLRDKMQPTPEQLAAYYEKNKGAFAKQEEVNIEDLFAPVSAEQPTTAALGLITAALDMASKTTDSWRTIAEAVERDHPTPKPTVYYRPIGWIERTDQSKTTYGEAFLNRAFTLKDDQISTPVQSSLGVHIIRKKGRHPAHVASMEEVKDQIVTKHKDEESKKQFRAEIKRMEEEIKKYKSIREFSQSVGFSDALTTMVATSDALIPEVGSVMESRAYVRGLRLNEVSEIIATPSQEPSLWFALQVVEEKPEHLPELSEVRGKVDEAYRKSKGIELAKTRSRAAFDAVKAGGDFAAACAAAPDKPTETEPFARESVVKPLQSKLIDFDKQGFALTPGSVGLSPFGFDAKSPDGFALWKVVDVQTPSRAEFDKGRRRLETERLGLLEQTTIAEWLADRRRAAGFEIVVKKDADK